MNLAHSTNYKLFNPKIKKDINLSVISDLHFSYMISDKKLNYILNFLIKEQPGYILIDGDLIDSVDMILDPNEKDRLINWLKELSKISKVIISLGSHDFYKKSYNKKGKILWQYCFKEAFFEEVNNIANVYVLNNTVYKDNDIYVLGYTQSMECYEPYRRKSLFHPVSEDKNQKLLEIKNVINKVGSIPKDRLNVFLSHSPIYLTDIEFENELEKFDYYISGHMHNGCVPPGLYELWPSNRGLISPNKEFFPKNERNTLINKEDKLIVNGPLTTFQECTGKLQILNSMFPYYFSSIDIMNNPIYNNEKVYVKKRYKLK